MLLPKSVGDWSLCVGYPLHSQRGKHACVLSQESPSHQQTLVAFNKSGRLKEGIHRQMKVWEAMVLVVILSCDYKPAALGNAGSFHCERPQIHNKGKLAGVNLSGRSVRKVVAMKSKSQRKWCCQSKLIKETQNIASHYLALQMIKCSDLIWTQKYYNLPN